jgi:hypothetical protein
MILLTVSGLILSMTCAFADNSQKRIEDLEKQVKELSQKVERMENTLTRSNGFMIVANVTCDIHTPFDGVFTATELSETAARQSVTKQCTDKLSDKSRCLPQFVTCKK